MEKSTLLIFEFFIILGVGERKKQISFFHCRVFLSALPHFFQKRYLASVNSNSSFKIFVMFVLPAGLKRRSSLFCDGLQCEGLVHVKCVDTAGGFLIGDDWCHFHVRGRNRNGGGEQIKHLSSDKRGYFSLKRLSEIRSA